MKRMNGQKEISNVIPRILKLPEFYFRSSDGVKNGLCGYIAWNMQLASGIMIQKIVSAH